MNEELLSLQDILAALRRHLLLIALTVFVCEGVAVVVAKTMPRKYRSTALLNVQATYFDVPLLGESIIGSRDYLEMQSQKKAIMRIAVSEDFLDKEGEKYGLFKSAAGTPARVAERVDLRKVIDYETDSRTTFQINAVGKTAEIAYGLTADTLAQIVDGFVSGRQKSIVAYRDSLRKQLETMGVVTTAESGSETSASLGNPKDNLARLETKLAALLSKFESNHPAVVAVKGQISAVKSEIEESGGRPAPLVQKAGPLRIDTSMKGRRTEFAEELLKKINYLDIALELESDRKEVPYLEIIERPELAATHFFPNTRLIAIGGLLVGFVLSLLAVTVLELKRITMMTPLAASRQLGIPLLGSLPVMLGEGDPFEPPKGSTGGR